MMLLLAVLAISTLGDSALALLTSIAASLSFSYYFVDQVNSFAITTVQGGITFAAMALTALTGSRLAIRAARRAEEAIRRREEMERLQQLGGVLLAAVTVAEAAQEVVGKLVELFGLTGALLRIAGEAQSFRAGNVGRGSVSIIPIHAGARADMLELYGPQPSVEVRSALASMIGLVIERARSSEERARIEATQRGEELRSTVLNALAHDFKTPLTSIKAAASALRASDDPGSDGDHELAVIIDEEADRLDLLIRESLDLARFEEHRANPRREECRMSEIVERATARAARYLGKREIEIDVPEDLPPIFADRFLLEQMLIQVVDNAGKYSKPGSTIRVSAEQVENGRTSGKQGGGAIVLSVRNEGEIPEDERALIFGKFYRGSRDRTATEGTGLGLAIAKTIAEAYQGRFWLDMEPKGPAFRFELPLGEKAGASLVSTGIKTGART
jgi:two-component system sensor histidine kinase KdpD